MKSIPSWAAQRPTLDAISTEPVEHLRFIFSLTVSPAHSGCYQWGWSTVVGIFRRLLGLFTAGHRKASLECWNEWAMLLEQGVKVATTWQPVVTLRKSPNLMAEIHKEVAAKRGYYAVGCHNKTLFRLIKNCRTVIWHTINGYEIYLVMKKTVHIERLFNNSSQIVHVFLPKLKKKQIYSLDYHWI